MFGDDGKKLSSEISIHKALAGLDNCLKVTIEVYEISIHKALAGLDARRERREL